MIGIFFLIDQVAIGLYAILAGMILLHAYRFIRAQGEMRATYFELERDLARDKQSTALTAIILAAEACLLLLGVQLAVVPFFESEQTLEERLASQQQTIEDRPFFTDTPLAAAAVANELDIEEVSSLGEDEIGFISTPTLTPTPVGTLLPNPPAVEGCVDDRAMLQVPANGMRVFQAIPVRGTAFVDNFALAKIEIRGESTFNEYGVVDTINTQVRDVSEFSQFIPAAYAPGRYEFRLMVFDITNTAIASCKVTIFITEPPVTATPTPRIGGS